MEGIIPLVVRDHTETTYSRESTRYKPRNRDAREIRASLAPFVEMQRKFARESKTGNELRPLSNPSGAFVRMQRIFGQEPKLPRRGKKDATPSGGGAAQPPPSANPSSGGGSAGPSSNPFAAFLEMQRKFGRGSGGR